MNAAQLQLLEDHIFSTPGSEPVEPCEPLILLVREMARRDWATRVLDSWAERNEEALAPAPVFHRYMFSRVGSAPACRWTILVGCRIEHLETPAAARHAAALAAWPQLTHEQCQEIGACP